MAEENVRQYINMCEDQLCTRSVFTGHACRYRDGALKAKQGLSEATSSAVDLAARELVSLTESYGAGPVDEGDIDELLQWTNGLNYDKSVCLLSC